MRDIKFRAWNTITERYHYNIQNVHDEEFSDSFQNILDDDELIVEEFTGLKDKNGVEIYEGDIVQYGEDKDFIFVVIFKYGCFYAHNILGEKFMTDSLLGSLVMSEKVSVIGNIHENPELLEEK